MFNNVGNMGIALALFVFTNVPYVIDGATPYADLGLFSVVSIMIIQTVTSNTYGFYQAGAGRLSTRDALNVLFHMPMSYAIPLALLCKLLPFDLHGLFFYAPLNIFANAFVGVAMIALGVQINRTPLNFFKTDVMLASLLRLVISPLLAAVITVIFILFYGPMHPIAAQTIVITYSVPTAINMALIAIEMKNNPEYATQIVMGTTILSAITMPLFITFAYYLFPLY
jgi:transporter, auxin efflux carrier (AEC) family protein